MMRRSLPVFLLICLGGVVLFAFDWPLEQIVMTSTFGEHRGDHFHAGIDLGGGEQSIFPISPGELVFSYREGEDFSSLPVGLGNFIVLQHQGGIRSLYAHLAEGSLDPTRRLYDRSQPLGVVGSSGYSSGKHLHLTIIDTEMDTIINPLLLLPPLLDAQAPVIKDVSIRAGQDLIGLEDGMTVNRAEVEVFATIYDLREDISFLWKLAPYKVFLSQDGREISNLIFDSLVSIQTAGQGLGARQLVLINTEREFSRLYEAPWLLRLGKINLVPGETALTVFAADFAGNESSKEYALTVLE
ncbi:MAG: M23 family metallopeptidase [Spirochaetales bacterium]|nr:M23 family metallopeptidase [Spirochaetales bacterium]